MTAKLPKGREVFREMRQQRNLEWVESYPYGRETGEYWQLIIGNNAREFRRLIRDAVMRTGS